MDAVNSRIKLVSGRLFIQRRKAKALARMMTYVSFSVYKCKTISSRHGGFFYREHKEKTSICGKDCFSSY